MELKATICGKVEPKKPKWTLVEPRMNDLEPRTMELPQQRPAVFQESALPIGTSLAGLSALVQAFKVSAPVRYAACISEQNIKGHIKEQGRWLIYSKRHELDPTVEAHLNFAMRYEYVDLLVLKRIFLALPPDAVAQYVASAPTSILTRRAWYLYELLTGQTLPAVSQIERAHTTGEAFGGGTAVSANLAISAGISSNLRSL
jgi:hypothetical protein